MRRNRLRELLNQGRPTLGTRILSAWPTVIELVGRSQMFDYVEFCGEYAPYDHQSLDSMGRAVELFDHLTGMIKIEQESRMHTAARAVGAGFQSVLFADPRTADEARACVQAVRSERPASAGRQGVNLHRAALADAGSQAWADAMDEVVIALMIEKKEAIENLDEILSVPGVDMVQFGPADFANSIGVTGQFDHPKVKEAERHMIESAMSRGVAVRVELSGPEGWQRYRDLGVQHFNIGVDVKLLFDWWCHSGAAMRDALGMEPVNRPDPKSNTKRYGDGC